MFVDFIREMDIRSIINFFVYYMIGIGYCFFVIRVSIVVCMYF